MAVNEMMAMTILIALAIFLVAMLIWFASTIIKSTLFPPCADCANYSEDNGYPSYSTLRYRCNKCRDEVTGNPKRCGDVRGSIKCWFENKQ